MISAMSGGMGPTGGPAAMGQVFRERFSKADADGSGALSASEFESALQARRPGAVPGSGAASSAELFAKLDTNGDGGLGADELRQARSARLEALQSTVQAFGRCAGLGGVDGIDGALGSGCSHGGRMAGDDSAASAATTANAQSDPLRWLLEQINQYRMPLDAAAPSLLSVA